MYKLSLLKMLLLLAVFGFSLNQSRAQLVGGQTYTINGANDLVAPVDTFANLMGSATGPAYGFVSFLNQFGINPQSSGQINVILRPGYSGVEPAPIVIGAGTNGGYPNMRNDRPIVIRPQAGSNFTITTNAALPANGALLRILGSWFVTIDGEGTTGQNNITFRVTSASGNTRVVDISPTSGQAVQGITVRNCNIYGNSTASANTTFAGIYVGGPNATPQTVLRGRNENMTFENNYIVASQNGIYYRGLANTINNQDRFITIRNNTIGDITHNLDNSLNARLGGAANNAGIYVNAVAMSTVEGNTIRHCLANSPNFSGIILTHEGGVANASQDSAIRVERNRIFDLNTTAAGGVYGIRVTLGTHPNKKLNILLANNSIRNISTTGAQSVVQSFIYPVGILVENAANDAGIEIFYNTIQMAGDNLPNNAVSANVGFGANVTGGVVFMNNMLSNTMGRAANNTLGAFTYNVVLGGVANPFLYSSFNNYHNSSTSGAYHYVARANNVDYASLVGYRGYSVSDSSSWSAIPPTFDNANIATVGNGVSHRTWNRGIDITQFWRFYPSIFNAITYKVNNDILGTNRNNLGRFASIGCHQWVGDSSNFNIGLLAAPNRIFGINGTNNFPTNTSQTGSFANLATAIEYLNAYGVGGSGNVILEFQTGYTGETGYLPIMQDYPGANLGRPVIFRVANDVANVTITPPNAANFNNSAVLRAMGVKWVTFDGGLAKKFTFQMPALATNTVSRVISITPTDAPTQQFAIRNARIIGNSNNAAPITQFGVYIGAPITSGVPIASLTPFIDNITIQGCIIEAVRTGIHARGMGSCNLLDVRGNVIGGTVAPGGAAPTTFLGGAADQAGVFLKGFRNSEIDSNIIRNCVATTNISNGFRGIDMDEPGNANMFGNIINRNQIYNLVTTTGNYTIGIRILMSNTDTLRSHIITNNFIGRIIGNGAGANFSAFNPNGIVIDAAGVLNAPGLNIAHNTVNLSGSGGLGLANSASAALFITANIRGGTAIVNNIFGNQMDRTTAGNKYAVLIGHNVSPFTTQNTLFPFAANNNNYFVGGLGGTLFVGGHANGTVNRANIIEWRQFTSPTPNTADGNSFSWPLRFISDTTPEIDMTTAGLVPGSGAFLSLICSDIYGNARFQCPGSNTLGRWVGALEGGNTSPALQGGQSYLINGTQNPPTQASPGSGSFRTVRAAIDYLNSQGVDGTFGGVQPVRLVISTGYAGETDPFTGPITVSDYPRQNANRPVILTVAADQNHTISYTGPAINAALIPNASFIRLSGSQHFIIDGSNNGSTSRNLTILMPTAFTQATNKVIDIVSGVATIQANNPASSNNIIRNCIIRGNSTTTVIQNFAAIYSGGLTTPSNALFGLNNNNQFVNNEIGAVQYGIYLRGTNTRGLQDFGAIISNNEIGGNVAPGGSAPTTYFGGVANAAGISIIAQANASIVGNTIKNNIQTATSPRAIELQTIAGQNTVLDSNIAISRNNIYNIRTNSASAAYGIYVNFLNDVNNVNRNIRIVNNMISGISSFGTNRTSTLANNPYGIYLDATANMVQGMNNEVGVSVVYNSINLGVGSTMTTANAVSACLGIDGRIKNGVLTLNNIFQNRLGGNASSIRAATVIVGSNDNPFSSSKDNNYFTNAAAPTVNSNLISNGTAATPNTFNLWNEIQSFTGDDSLSITFQVPFLNDTVLAIASSNNVFHGSGRPTNFSNVDFYNNPRNIFEPSIGAHEFSGTYNDVVIPRVFNTTEPTNCNPGFAILNFDIFDRLLVRDTFYYQINNDPVVAIQAFSGSGRSRSYIIPTIPSGAIVRYRVSARDFSNNVGAYPSDKLWDTLNSNIANYPYTNSFDGPNSPTWTVQTLSGNATWQLDAFGSAVNPPMGPRTGQRTALFEASVFTANARARLVSPCFDFSNTVSPTLRFYMSQNSDLTNRQDSIIVRVSAGGGFWSNPIRTVRRVNTNFNFPGYALIEVCLAEYNGFGSIRIGIDGVASGSGHNIVIDDLMVYDDAQTQTFSPSVFAQCFRDAITLNIQNSSVSHRYDVVDALTNDILATADGNGSTLGLQFLPANRDTFRYFVNASNTQSFAIRSGFGSPFVTCSNIMPTEVTALVGRYGTNQLVVPGSPFNGSFNGGGAFDPDGARVGDTLVYRINAPGNLTNSDYGTRWTITSVQISTQNNNTMPFVFTPPSGNTAGTVRIIVPAASLDSTYFLNFNYRLIASTCDSLVQRMLRIATPAGANFVSNPTNNACALTAVNFQSVSTLVPENFPYTYLWTFGDNTTSTVVNPNKTYQTPGNYTVTLFVTDRFGLRSSFSRQITVLPAPIVNFNFTTPCAGDSTVFTPSTQPGGSTYLWTFPNNSTDTREVGRFAFPEFDRSYSATLRITNTDGCANQLTRSLFVFAKPRARFTSAPHCQGTVVPYVDSTSIANGNALGYTWIWGNGQTSLGPTPVYRYPASGTFNATLRVASSFGCVDSIVVPITIYDKPAANFSFSNACFGDQIVLNNATTFAGGAQNLGYIWDFGDNTFSNERLPNKSYSSVGNYFIRLTAIDNINGCRDSIRIPVTVNYKPVAQFNAPTTVCEGSPVSIFNNSYTIDQSATNCAWDFGNGSTDNNCQVTYSYPQHGIFTMRLIVTSANGGCRDTATQVINVNVKPNLDITTERLDITLPSFFYGQNRVKFTPSILDGIDYTWNFGDVIGSTSKQVAPTFVYNNKGTYRVRLTVQDGGGCIVTDSVDVEVFATVGVQDELAAKFQLNAYPNPFASSANVEFTLEQANNITITVTDLLGRVMKVTELGRLNTGKHNIHLTDDNFGAAATYIIKVSIGDTDVYKTLIKQ